MDPLSSLSVASSVIQIFDSTSKLWEQIREARETLLSDADRLRSLNSGLSKLLTPENLQRMPTTTEENVVSLCKEFDDAAGGLVTALQKLSLDDRDFNSEILETDAAKGTVGKQVTQRSVPLPRNRRILIGRKWDAVQLAIKAVWRKKDIDKLCERVDALKQSLASAILVNIQHDIVSLDRKMAQSVKWDNVNSFQDTLRIQNLDTAQNEARLMNFLKAYEEYASASKLMSTDRTTETSLPGALKHGDATLEPWSEKSQHIAQSLMKNLAFSEILQRQESILETYKDTFQWIYKPPRDVDRPWDSFSTWLTEGRGVYWITGKAGSGKSTLMRMLHQNERTLDLLRNWCRGSPLVTASFFFWNSGSKMQMSQDGLLRSILLQTIEQRLQQADSDNFADKLVCFATTLPSLQDLHFKDLLQLLRFVIEDGGNPVKFFLILDGLDEFDGEKSKLISLIHTLGTYDHLKVCVSSRPWLVFEDGFRQQPSLVLQHLTHQDILEYVKDNLERESSFYELSRDDPFTASRLIGSITEKASGVFLWVILVVESVIKGLADGYRVKDLEARLEEVPEELEQLYSKMLHGLQGRYFKDAARLFQIHRATRWRGFNGRTGANLPLLVYSFADEHGADLDETSNWPPKALTPKELFMTSVSMKRRISSRCNGLLEIDEPATTTGEIWKAEYKQLDRLISEAESGDLSVLPTFYSHGHNLARSSVQYLHRTVKDYLEAPEIWRSIESAAPTEGEHYWVFSLCLGYIRLWKNGDKEKLLIQEERLASSAPLSSDVPMELNTATTVPSMDENRTEYSRLMLENCLDLATSFLPTSTRTYVRLLDAIGAAIFDVGAEEAECNRPEVLQYAIWRHPGHGFVFEDFLSLAVNLELFEYVDAKLSNLQHDLRAKRASKLLVVAALKSQKWLTQSETSYQKDSDSPERVYSAEKEPKYPIEGFVTNKQYLKVPEREEGKLSFHMVQILMRHGADPDFPVYPNGLSARHILDLRRSELTDPYSFDNILSSFSAARDNPGRLDTRQLIRSVIEGLDQFEDNSTIATINCRLRWEVLACCETEIEDLQTIAQTVTFTGDSNQAQAASCAEYLRQTWPKTGTTMMGAFHEAVIKRICDVHFSPGHRLRLQLEPALNKPDQPESACAEITGSLHDVIETLEQLAWLAATFRKPQGSTMTSSYANFTRVPDSTMPAKGDPLLELTLISPRPVSFNAKSPGNCWIPLLRESVLACGFPIATRNAGLGLEIPVPLMMHLAGVHYPMEYNDQGLVLRSHVRTDTAAFSMLVPTQKLGETIQWHFIEANADHLSPGNDDENPTSFMDDMAKPDSWYQTMNLNVLINSRALLGCWPFAKVLVGTEDFHFRTIRESGLPTAGLEAELSTAGNINVGGNVSAGIATILRVGMTSGIAFGYEVRRAQQAIIPPGQLGPPRSFRDASQQPLLLYDSEAQSAWVVSELSVALDMAHHFLASLDLAQSIRTKLRYAAATADGGAAASAALDACRNEILWEDDTRKIRWHHLISIFLSLFAQRKPIARLPKPSAWNPGKNLQSPRGWEYKQLRGLDPDVHKQKKANEHHKKSRSWWEITNNPTVLVLFGKGFGQVVIPDLDRSSDCPTWRLIPCHRGLLTASMPCLQKLSKNDEYIQLKDTDLHWHQDENSTLFEACQPGRPCIRIQEFQKPRRFISRRNRINAPVQNLLRSEGAVVFGEFPKGVRGAPCPGPPPPKVRTPALPLLIAVVVSMLSVALMRTLNAIIVAFSSTYKEYLVSE